MKKYPSASEFPGFEAIKLSEFKRLELLPAPCTKGLFVTKALGPTKAELYLNFGKTESGLTDTSLKFAPDAAAVLTGTTNNGYR